MSHSAWLTIGVDVHGGPGKAPVSVGINIPRGLLVRPFRRIITQQGGVSGIAIEVISFLSDGGSRFPGRLSHGTPNSRVVGASSSDRRGVIF